jgi:hypothetical protein
MNDSNSPQSSGPGNSDVGADANEPDDLIDAELAALLADPNNWVEPPEGLDDGIVAAVRSEAALGAGAPHLAAISPRGARRWGTLRPALIGAAAAIVFVFGGIVVLSALSGVEETETFSVELISTGLILDVGGDVDVTSLDSGLRIDLSARGLPRRDDGAFYEGWVRTADGNLIPVGTFHAGDDVTLWAGVELDRVELFAITLETASGPDDPAQGSSGEVVLRAEITP